MNIQTKTPEGWGGTFLTEEGRRAWLAFETASEEAVVLLDGDGTMWDIVMFPTMPDVDPRYPEVLRRLVARTAATGMLTGRSVTQVREFGLLVDRLHVVGQFGCEWYHDRGYDEWVARPDGLDEFDRRLPALLTAIQMDRLVSIEDVKSHFRAVHYKEGTDKSAVNWLLKNLKNLADETGLAFLPGHNVVEMGPEVDKKVALLRFVYEFVATHGKFPSVILYAGDSAPDLRAFMALDLLRQMGVHTLKVCTSDNPAVREQADLVVPGPQGTLAMCELLSGVTPE